MRAIRPVAQERPLGILDVASVAEIKDDIQD
jgi:hypothetical protein